VIYESIYSTRLYIAPEYSYGEEIIDDVSLYVEVYLTLLRSEILRREVPEKISLNFIGISRNMRSDIDAYILYPSRESLDPDMTYMESTTTPSTMQSRALTVSHEDDDRTVSTEATDRDIRASRIDTIDFWKGSVLIPIYDFMYLYSMSLMGGADDIRMSIPIPEVTIRSLWDGYLESRRYT
jgi:hypothetical protein